MLLAQLLEHSLKSVLHKGEIGSLGDISLHRRKEVVCVTERGRGDACRQSLKYSVFYGECVLTIDKDDYLSGIRSISVGMPHFSSQDTRLYPEGPNTIAIVTDWVVEEFTLGMRWFPSLTLHWTDPGPLSVRTFAHMIVTPPAPPPFNSGTCSHFPQLFLFCAHADPFPPSREPQFSPRFRVHSCSLA